MMHNLLRWLRVGLGRREAGSIAVIFAFLLVPLLLGVYLAIDIGFYVRAQTRLNVAADAAAMAAVRAATLGPQTGVSTTSGATALGNQAGAQWFSAQLGTLNNATIPASSITVNTTYNPSPSKFSATVSYSGTVQTFFGGFIGHPNFGVSGTSTAVVSNSYVEVILMLDDSPSMLIGSTPADIKAMERATPCSTQAANENQDMNAIYAWVYTSGVGYNRNGSPPDTPPPTNSVNGICDPRYTGDKAACPYAPGLPNISTSNPWYCTNGGGTPATVNGKTVYVAGAPCAFACHDRADNKDYLGLARSLSPTVTLRLDVVRAAAVNVATMLSNRQAFSGQFTMGAWLFSNGDPRYSGLSQVYPSSGEAGSDFSAAKTAIQNTINTQPVTFDANQTNFPASIQGMANSLTPSGDGSAPNKAIKNLFIVTDGMENYTSFGPMTDASNETLCKTYWDNGYRVYVLYTPYLPLPQKQYLNSIMQYAEPKPNSSSTDSANVTALKACARKPGNFFVASDPTAINDAMQAMTADALNTPGRLTQ